MYPPLRYHTESLHCPKNPLHFTFSSSLSPSEPLITTDLCTISIVSSFPECQTVGIIRYVSISDRLLSLSHMHLRAFCVLSCLIVHFFVLLIIPHWMDVPHFVYPCRYIEGHLGRFQVWANMGGKTSLKMHLIK